MQSLTLILHTIGKTDRQKLISMFEESLKFEFAFSDKELEAEGLIIASDFEKARVLLGAITKVLGFTKNEKPSLADNFFEIGGDSLNMVQVIGYCADVGYVIGMTEFALCSTLADLVKILRHQSNENELNMNSDLSVPSVLKLEELTAASSGKIIGSRIFHNNCGIISKIVKPINQDVTETSDFRLTQVLDTQRRI